MTATLTPKKAARPVTPLGILVEQLEQTLELSYQAGVPNSLLSSLEKAHQLAAGIDTYLTDCSTSESSSLANLVTKTCEEDWSRLFSDGDTVRQLEQEMLSGHLEGQILKIFIKMLKAHDALEIGMFTGYSALAMAEALPDNGRVIACEVDQYVAEFAQACFDSSPHGHKIDVKVAPALETLSALAQAGESFDLVFIDADKTEYESYFKIVLEEGLLRPHGIICVDNTLLQGQPYLPESMRSKNGEAIAQFNDMVAQDPRVEQVLLPVRDGLTIIRRK
ncbi:MAG: O-methyltransferase [Microcystaceae cyanobacterium]